MPEADFERIREAAQKLSEAGVSAARAGEAMRQAAVSIRNAARGLSIATTFDAGEVAAAARHMGELAMPPDLPVSGGHCRFFVNEKLWCRSLAESSQSRITVRVALDDKLPVPWPKTVKGYMPRPGVRMIRIRRVKVQTGLKPSRMKVDTIPLDFFPRLSSIGGVVGFFCEDERVYVDEDGEIRAKRP